LLLQICFSPDGRYVAAGSREGMVVIWNVQSGDIITEMKTSDMNDVMYSTAKTSDANSAAENIAIMSVLWHANIGLVACDKMGRVIIWK
jgi:WD40 repeat protein